MNSLAVCATRVLKSIATKLNHGGQELIPTIDHWIGQEQAIRRFKVALEASYSDGTRLPHQLYVGPPGTGKTLLANLAAKEMGVEIHERIAQVLNFPGAMNGLLLHAKDKEIVFLDEIHELAPPAQTLLYRAMEGQQISLRTNADNTLNMPLKDITIIGCTTDEYRLLSALRQRFKILIPFTHYDETSLAKIIAQRARLEGIDIEPEIAIQIAKRSRGVPRLAVRLLESCHRYVRSIGESKICMAHAEATFSLDQIDELGLGPDEQRFVNFLMKQRGKPVRLFTLESAIGVHRRTIQEVIEPFLIRMGLIERLPQGRVITEQGMRHVERLNEAQPVEATS